MDSDDGTELLGIRPIRVAHADKSGKADPRWPLGSALNPIQPGASEAAPSIQRYVRKNVNPLQDNNDY